MDYVVDKWWIIWWANLKVVYSNNPWWWLASRVEQVVPRWISWTFPFWCGAWPNRAPQQFSKPRQLRDFQMGDPRCSGQGHTSCNFWLQTCQTSRRYAPEIHIIAYDIVQHFTTYMIIPLQVELLVHTWKIVHGNPGKYNVTYPQLHTTTSIDHIVLGSDSSQSLPAMDADETGHGIRRKWLGRELAENLHSPFDLR